MIACINMVSSCAPPRKGESHMPGVIGFAIAVEDESGTIIRTVVRKVMLHPGRLIDPGWTSKYAGDIADIGNEADGVEAAQAAGEALAALDGVTQVAAHFAHFHKEQLRLLIDDGGARFDVLADLDWFDTMHKATKSCAVPASAGRGFKPPSLVEASEILTGTTIPSSLAALPWREALLTNLSAARGIWRVLNGRGGPAEPIRELPEGATL